ncbi:MAG: c-type cytochrome biogenesis protein CcsB [Sulfuriflexus sp.]|nr:c-type cytochrome biogenesis protein CcsB [Sulfuriflexus sp.]
MSATLDPLNYELNKPFFKTLSAYDWIFAALVTGGAFYLWDGYASLMDVYEVGILFGMGLGMIGLGWYWKQSRTLMLSVAIISIYAVIQYEPAVMALKAEGMDGRQAIAALSDWQNKEQGQFIFKYFLSSATAIGWMCFLFGLATVIYFFNMFVKSEFPGRVATKMTWIASAMGLIGLMVRWRESYLINFDIGHIPVSNLYEVFVLFSIITALIYLFYEMRYKTRALGGFVLLVISAAVAFLLWYKFDKNADEIAPLVPALKSYWMKIHVPANFIGYGCFALAAMVGVVYLLRNNAPEGGLAARVLPPLDMLDDVMYKSIALGFAWFTIATVLGALWAAEAWGGYWSWDPKETWALIVWLNYAAWLHMRLTKGWRGSAMAWWSVIGLFVTLFAFLGVNMFLSGLHSYGEL